MSTVAVGRALLIVMLSLVSLRGQGNEVKDPVTGRTVRVDPATGTLENPAWAGSRKATGRQAVPEKLDDRLQQALRTNPEIVLAQTAVQQAQARLNQVRLEISRQVVAAHFEIEKLRTTVETLQLQMARAEQTYKMKATTVEEVHAARLKVIAAKADISQAEATLRYLLGIDIRRRSQKLPAVSTSQGGGGTRLPGSTQVWNPHLQTPGLQPGQAIPLIVGDADAPSWLDKRTQVQGKGVPLDSLLKAIFKSAGYKNKKFVYHTRMSDEARQMPITLDLGRTRVKGALQAIADNYKLAFVFRSYGVLVTYREEAESRYRDVYVIR